VRGADYVHGHLRCDLDAFARRLPTRVRGCRYTDAVERHFRASVLDALPPQYDSLLQQIEDVDAGASYDMSALAVRRMCGVLCVAFRALTSRAGALMFSRKSPGAQP
jgi:hypothetical protein